MKIIAKKGTAFEQTVRVMCEKMTEGIIGARDMVEKAVGIRPKDTYHIFHWGTISKLTPEFVFDVEDGERISPKYLRKKKVRGMYGFLPYDIRKARILMQPSVSSPRSMK